MQTKEVVILSGVRTAIGDYGGALKDVAPTALAAACVREAVSRSGIAPDQIGHAVFGNVIHTEPRDMYISRVAALDGGLPDTVPALTLNRLCGSAMQAIISSAQMIMLGDIDTAIAGGAESMSRAGYQLPNLRWGQRMGDGGTVDMMVGALTDPFGHGHMGVTAENVAKRFGISREDQDAFAAESHRRAAAAIESGRFAEQIVPIGVKTRKEIIQVAVDEHVRADINAASLAKLRPAFDKAGSVTAGNASGLNDGGAALVLMEREAAAKKGLKPLARIVSYAFSAVEPDVMGIGPIQAVRTALARAKLSIADMDVIESNEAFAAQALAVGRELDLPSDRTNPNGGAIALGHPIGATGAIITVKAAYELQRIKGKYALATMCIGGGQGIALVLARD
ncbi:MAG: acetyl-CoA C-acyltransferase family protein [Rhodospirillaceae bacterium]|nr:acetyl-CoA C-acyltransferase family protein [Rhodospirillales bacterium]